jgi:hypothetical protein
VDSASIFCRNNYPCRYPGTFLNLTNSRSPSIRRCLSATSGLSGNRRQGHRTPTHKMMEMPVRPQIAGNIQRTSQTHRPEMPSSTISAARKASHTRQVATNGV